MAYQSEVVLSTLRSKKGSPLNKVCLQKSLLLHFGGSRLCAIGIRLVAYYYHFEFYNIDPNFPFAFRVLHWEIDEYGIFINLCSRFSTTNRTMHT